MPSADDVLCPNGCPRDGRPVPVRFRLAQKGFGAERWLPQEPFPDGELAARGFALGGPGRSMAALSMSERAELFRLLKKPAKRLPREQQLREGELLARCPFYGFVPPLDVDVNEESAEFHLETSRATALRYARALDEAVRAVGLGRPSWHRTNDRGGLHGDLRVPPEVEHPDLLRAIGVLARRAADRAGVPVLTKLPTFKKERPAVYLDDSIFNRYAESRAVQWRLVGAAKPGGLAKAPVDLFADVLPLPVLPASVEPLPADAEVLRAALLALEHEPAERARAATIRVASYAVANPIDLAYVLRHPLLARIWFDPTALRDGKPDRSRKDARFAIAALRVGASESDVASLLRHLPGGKCSEDQRDDRYIDHTLAWARTQLAANPRPAPRPRNRIAEHLPPSSPPPDEGPPPDVEAEPEKPFARPTVPRHDGATRDRFLAIARERFRPGEVGYDRLVRLAGCGYCKHDVHCLACEKCVHEAHELCSLPNLCLYEAYRRADAYAAFVSLTWPEKVAVARFEVEETSEITAVAKGIKTKRQGVRQRYPKGLGYRWLLGVERGAFFVPCRESKGYVDGSGYLETALRKGLLPAGTEIVILTRDEAARLVRDLWLEPALRFADLVRRGDVVEVVRFPFLVDERAITRTSGNRVGKGLPWPTETELRKRLVDEARLERGLVDVTSCPDCQGPVAHRFTDVRDGQLLYQGSPGEKTWRATQRALAALHVKLVRETTSGLAPPSRPRPRPRPVRVE